MLFKILVFGIVALTAFNICEAGYRPRSYDEVSAESLDRKRLGQESDKTAGDEYERSRLRQLDTGSRRLRDEFEDTDDEALSLGRYSGIYYPGYAGPVVDYNRNKKNRGLKTDDSDYLKASDDERERRLRKSRDLNRGYYNTDSERRAAAKHYNE